MAETMRAVAIREPGGPEVLELREVPVPRLAPGEIRVSVVASGVNRADLLQRRGGHPAPPGSPRDIPGMEFAGTVDQAGEGVTRWRPGDRVMGIIGGGGYAQYVVTHEDAAVRAPAGMGLEEAGAIPEVFMTAFDAVVLQEGLRAGETLLVHAVGSGVGTAGLQLGRAFGARVVGTSRSPDKLRRAEELGLEHPVLGDEGWPERVLEITGGHGVDVILDLVGGPYLAGNQKVLAQGGRHIVVGVTGGPRTEVDLRALMTRRGSIRGTVLRVRPLEEKIALTRAFEARALAFFDTRALRPVVDRVLPAADAAEAHRLLEANATFGKVLLRW
ncbi:MAG TPA: NAD(P)H-quinone oxidoreductase [Longimicrobiales bacterium]|nr:NAD(P)H-quinone oxidoreductase [Longimicrobiales bacterium]